LRTLIVTTVLVLFLAQIASSTDTTFIHAYGGLRYEEGTSIVATLDGGYMMVGSTGSFGLGNSDIYAVKVDSNGTYEWSKSFGGPNSDVGMSVKQTADSGYIITGYTNSLGAGGYDVYVVKTDSIGDSLWTRTFGGGDWDFGYEVVQTMDGGYAIAGETFSYGSGDNDMYLIRLDPLGDSLWTRTYGGAEQDYARTLVETADTGFIVAGATYTFDVDSGDAFIIKTNSVGDTTWTANYGGTGTDLVNDVIKTIDMGYACLGTTTSYNAKNEDMYLFRIGQLGVMSWFNTIGSLEGNEQGNSLVELRYKRYAALGYSDFFGGGGDKIYMAITNEIGGFALGRSYGFDNDERGFSIARRQNGGIAIFGTTNSIGVGLTDMLLITTDSVGKDYNDTTFTPLVYATYLDVSIPEAPVDVASIETPNRKVSLYPNPAQLETSINIEGESMLNKITQFQLYDVTGRKIKVFDLNQPFPFTMNMSSLRAGVYFYELVIKDKTNPMEAEVYKGKLILTAE
jgi:hypothetical protein